MAVLLPGIGDLSSSVAPSRSSPTSAPAPSCFPSGEEIRVSVSVGLANVPADAVDLQGLYLRADRALYEAKDQAGTGSECWQTAHRSRPWGDDARQPLPPWVRATCKPACTSAAFHADATGAPLPASSRPGLHEGASSRATSTTRWTSQLPDLQRHCAASGSDHFGSSHIVEAVDEEAARHSLCSVAALLTTASRARGASGMASKNTARSLITGPVVAVFAGNGDGDVHSANHGTSGRGRPRRGGGSHDEPGRGGQSGDAGEVGPVAAAPGADGGSGRRPTTTSADREGSSPGRMGTSGSPTREQQQ